MKALMVLFSIFLFAAGTGLSSQGAAVDLQGTVVRAGGTDPLGNAAIALESSSGDHRTFAATTSEAGKFIIRGVPPGKYQLKVARTGYVDSDRPLTLEDGQRIRNAVVPLNPTGAISGRIFDEFGEPVIGAEVRAMQHVYQHGGRILVPVQSAITDDRGEYRLFWLPPGRYFISAVGPNRTDGSVTAVLNDASGDFFSSSERSLPAFPFNPIGFIPPPRTAAQDAAQYVPVYFRNARNPQAASGVEVRSAATASGIDLTVERVQKHRIRGMVVDARTGATLQDVQTLRVDDPPSYPEDELLQLASENFPAPGIRQQAGGFEMRDVPTGKYILIAQAREMTGRIAVEVRDEDVDDVVIPVMPGFDIAGHITIERPQGPKGELDLAKILVVLHSDPYILGFGGGSERPTTDGRITLKNIAPGDYHVVIYDLPERYYVQSIRLQSQDVLNNGLHVERQPDAQMEIVIGADAGSLKGTVRDEKSQMIPNARVALVPGRRSRLDLFKTARTDESGEFHFGSVPPGDYKVFASEGIEDGAWRDPDFIEPYETRGTPVKVGPASEPSVTVGLIR